MAVVKKSEPSSTQVLGARVLRFKFAATVVATLGPVVALARVVPAAALARVVLEENPATEPGRDAPFEEPGRLFDAAEGGLEIVVDERAVFDVEPVVAAVVAVDRVVRVGLNVPSPDEPALALLISYVVEWAVLSSSWSR